MDSIRQSKHSKLIQKEIGEIFRKESRNLFEGAMISVTSTRVSPDLSVTKVYISIFAPGKDIKEIFKLVNTNNKLIRLRLGETIGKQVRIIPNLVFFLDDSLDYAENIENLLKQ
jgi:ribosome-binding factor A